MESEGGSGRRPTPSLLVYDKVIINRSVAVAGHLYWASGCASVWKPFQKTRPPSVSV